MTTREFYETKAKECGYDDFLHWIDCYDYILQPQKIVEWTDELVKNLTIHAVIASASFKNDLEKAIEMGESVGFNEDGGYDYFSQSDAFEAVMNVLKKHLL